MACLSVTFVDYAQTVEDIDTISLAHDSSVAPVYLSDRIKI